MAPTCHAPPESTSELARGCGRARLTTALHGTQLAKRQPKAKPKFRALVHKGWVWAGKGDYVGLSAPSPDTSSPLGGRRGAGEAPRTRLGASLFLSVPRRRARCACCSRAGVAPRAACPARAAARPRLTIEPRGRSERVGRRVDPGPWGGRALPGPRERRGSRPEKGGGRGGRQSPRTALAYLGSPGLGTDHAPVSAQVRAGGRTCPAWRAGHLPGDPGAHPLSQRSGGSRLAAATARATARGARCSVSERARTGPARSETHRILAPTTAPGARQRSTLHRFILPPASPPSLPAPLWVPDFPNQPQAGLALISAAPPCSLRAPRAPAPAVNIY